MEDIREILIQISKGCQHSFELVFKTYYNDIYTYVYSIIPDAQEADEIAQSCFVKLWEKRKEAAQINSLRSYLFRSAYNTCINKLEHEEVKRKYQSETEYRLRTIDIDNYNDTYIPEIKEHISNAVDNLPQKSKEVFKLKYFDGFSNKEICQKLDITKRTVESHLYTSLQYLRKNLKHLLIILLFFKF